MDMKHCLSGGFNIGTLTITFALPMLLLFGCAAEQPKKVEVQPVMPVAKVVVISAEARGEFDAAMSHIKAEEYDAGVARLRKAAEAAPNTPVPSVNLALVYKKTGKLKQAEDSLKQALSIDPDNPVANNELALLYRKAGKFKEAKLIYEKMLGSFPDFRLVHKNLGILCDLYLRDYSCALAHYVFYSDASPEDKTVKIWIADLQKRMGRQE